VSVRGVLHVHSAPPALCPHIEWAAAGVLGVPVNLPWVSQPAAPGMLRAELDWECRPGTAAAITSALTGWNRLRFEVSEDASPGCDSIRYSYTPDLGVFSAITMANGDILIPESRLRAAMTVATAAEAGQARRSRPAGGAASPAPPDRAAMLEEALGRLLGQPWDDELEPFRCAADGAPVRWLHATG
jgi:Protein of unknown function (DUF3145)